MHVVSPPLPPSTREWVGASFLFIFCVWVGCEPRVSWKQTLHLHKIGVRTLYILPYPDPTLVTILFVIVVVVVGWVVRVGGGVEPRSYFMA